MFKRILCPIDLRKLSMAALEIAGALAEQNDATISLVHVVPSPLPRPLEPVPDWERTVNTRLGRIAQEHFGDRARWDTVILRGDPAQAIMHAADDLDADLIVMATHGHKGINRLLLGSVAEQVVRESPIPVLTVRGRR
jgi:nucleotide-binding universal stress UspA family protein